MSSYKLMNFTDKEQIKKAIKIANKDAKAELQEFLDSTYFGGYFIVQVNTSGRIVRVVGSDICEPEDATLARSFGWVLDELNKAYENGYEDGEEEGEYQGFEKGYAEGKYSCEDF